MPAPLIQGSAFLFHSTWSSKCPWELPQLLAPRGVVGVVCVCWGLLSSHSESGQGLARAGLGRAGHWAVPGRPVFSWLLTTMPRRFDHTAVGDRCGVQAGGALQTTADESAWTWGFRTLRSTFSGACPPAPTPSSPGLHRQGSRMSGGCTADCWEAGGNGAGRGETGGAGSPQLSGCLPLPCWWGSEWARPWGEGCGRLGTLPEGPSLVRVLQQQVHGLREVVHEPVSLHFWVVLVTGPAEQGRGQSVHTPATPTQDTHAPLTVASTGRPPKPLPLEAGSEHRGRAIDGPCSIWAASKRNTPWRRGHELDPVLSSFLPKPQGAHLPSG